ncbi:MAG: anthranilate synthase component I family protein [Hydrogenothermaceae bacterium]|nr:anthranilate synthase component I family protein [Hydrogenothermaceae bacterium]
MVLSTYIYSNSEDGWLGHAGYYLFEKPILNIRYYRNRLIVGNEIIHIQDPLPIIQKFVSSGRFYTTGFISYEYGFYTLKNKSNVPKEGIPNIPLIYLNLYRSYREIKPKDSFFRNILKKIVYKTSKESFLEKIKKAKYYIQSGDVYQLNLSHRIDVEGIFGPLSIFLRLTKLQPTPYMMYIVDKDFRIISGSMELFLKKEKDKLITKPIKGTCDRSKDYRKHLLNNKKEIAENLMITDLMRNDLGRICRNVQVEKLFEVDEYTTLYQMSSTITGRLTTELTLKDIIYSTFPPGSVTGAPKKRATQIIDQLEDSRRTAYCGATLLIKPNFDFTMSVAIRQMIFTRDRCYIHVGAGIVADSEPQHEYQETLLKAKANLRSLTL